MQRQQTNWLEDVVGLQTRSTVVTYFSCCDRKRREMSRSCFYFDRLVCQTQSVRRFLQSIYRYSVFSLDHWDGAVRTKRERERGPVACFRLHASVGRPWSRSFPHHLDVLFRLVSNFWRMPNFRRFPFTFSTGMIGQRKRTQIFCGIFVDATRLQ